MKYLGLVLDCNWGFGDHFRVLAPKLVKYAEMLAHHRGYEKGPKDHGGENETKRGNWTGRFNFLLSLLGYSVGLGNVWRFPYLCFNNGGGTFLIPFTVMLIVVGLPLLFMELSFGQYAALGPVAAYDRFCPLFRGLGYGMVIVSSIVTLYYNVIIAWTIYYMAVSFISISYQLPWQNCDAEWSTKSESHLCF
ncbi:Sodium- and chloride-dependent neutral and basic amino acid transporter B(0+) [Papilio xuthus]|uniref:Transporter n=1 Tax=Papilio xuthus TaxID=66420 RepID=A0A0N0PFD0_PAPXU|nr:Sodium- and chloride-dependent neutral and basic amino acid transporter B(0+) [Papilio xuthus]